MGKLRFVRVRTGMLSDEKEAHFLALLQEATTYLEEHHVFLQLDEEEDPIHTKKALIVMARIHDLDLTFKTGRQTREIQILPTDLAPRDRSYEAFKKAVVGVLIWDLDLDTMLEKAGVMKQTWWTWGKRLMDEGVVEEDRGGETPVYRMRWP